MTSAPATQLGLDVMFDGALLPSAMAVIHVSVSMGDYSVIFGAGQRLTCNGVFVTQPDTRTTVIGTLAGTVTVPRQPPGGRYTFVYTDERGRQTTAVVPAPRVDFAITSPAAGARVPIPRRVDRRPTAITPTPNVSRPPELADAPLTVRYTVPYPAASLIRVPTSNMDDPNMEDSNMEDSVVASAHGACKEDVLKEDIPPECLQLHSDGQNATGVVDATGEATIADTHLPFGVGFENLAPGPGSVDVNMSVMWFLPATGFASFHVIFHDDASNPVTWESA